MINNCLKRWHHFWITFFTSKLMKTLWLKNCDMWYIVILNVIHIQDMNVEMFWSDLMCFHYNSYLYLKCFSKLKWILYTSVDCNYLYWLKSLDLIWNLSAVDSLTYRPIPFVNITNHLTQMVTWFVYLKGWFKLFETNPYKIYHFFLKLLK